MKKNTKDWKKTATKADQLTKRTSEDRDHLNLVTSEMRIFDQYWSKGDPELKNKKPANQGPQIISSFCLARNWRFSQLTARIFLCAFVLCSINDRSPFIVISFSP